MKIRTIYYKVNNISLIRDFYSSIFQITPKLHKNSEEWVEFDFGNINFSLICIGDDEVFGKSNCVPVFQFEPEKVEEIKKRIIVFGGNFVDHVDDGANSTVFSDPEGNEFEITNFDHN
jgi:predicted enzyme related to lactoylglutathione lyase